MTFNPKVALISATPAAIPPAVRALEAEFPEAQIWNLLDDRLLADAEASGGLTTELAERMDRLIEYANDMGASGVLLTCSMYGPVALSRESGVPVLAPDQAAFVEISKQTGQTVLVVTSLQAALEDTQSRLKAYLTASHASVNIKSVLASRAFGVDDPDALASHLELAVTPELGGVDLVYLAQYSLSPAAETLSRMIGKRVLSGPRSAAAWLRNTIQE